MSQRKGYGVVQTGASEWSDRFPCFSARPCKVVSWKGEEIKDKAGTSRRDDLAPHDGPTQWAFLVWAQRDSSDFTSEILLIRFYASLRFIAFSVRQS